MARFGLYLGITWLLTLAAAYGIGWWRGVKSVTQAVGQAGSSGIELVIIAIIIVAILSGIAAFRARGYLDRDRERYSRPE